MLRWILKVKGSHKKINSFVEKTEKVVNLNERIPTRLLNSTEGETHTASEILRISCEWELPTILGTLNKMVVFYPVIAQ